MKLSEAMMLGSTTCKMVHGDWATCALGAAANALSFVPFKFDVADDNCFDSLRIRSLFDAFPWIRPENVRRMGNNYGVTGMYFAGEIARRFDNDVCTGKMTLEALVDYVRSIEPECGECCQFQCTCAPKEAVPETKLVTAG